MIELAIGNLDAKSGTLTLNKASADAFASGEEIGRAVDREIGAIVERYGLTELAVFDSTGKEITIRRRST
jgi:hypothetical protein